MLAGYAGSDPEGEAWLESLRLSAGAGAGLERANVPGGGLLAPRLFHLPDGTVTALAGEPLWGPGEETKLEASWHDGEALRGVDGQWALARIGPAGTTLLLAHDPFGGYQLYHAQGTRALWFSTSMAALLAVPEIRRRRRLDLQAVHRYLVLSYVPAPCTLLHPVRCVPPLSALTFTDLPGGQAQVTSTFPLPDGVTESPDDPSPAALRDRFLIALERRVHGASGPPAVALSGGLDSTAVAAGLVHLGHRVGAFHLRFTEPEGEEEPYAEAVARHLGVPLQTVTVTPERDMEQIIRRTVGCMEQPYGDPVTVPLWLLNRAAAAAGCRVCFNGEGGDQLFAGWPNKAMFAAEVFGTGRGEERYDRVDAYLRTFHHFYGEEDTLYEPDLRAAAHETDLRVEIAPYLEEARLPDLFARLRWTNYRTKGSQNIMPRAAALARDHGLRMQAPLFDLDLARFALYLPGPSLLKGTSEKDLFKRAVESMLPAEVVRRDKRGMGVPVTHWATGPLRDLMRVTLLGGLGRRGLVRRRRLEKLLKGQLVPGEIRTRRVGEQLWQLAVLELWLQLHGETP